MEKCTICLEPLNHNLKKLKCKHYLHKKCYKQLFLQNSTGIVNCPICRKIISKKKNMFDSSNSINQDSTDMLCRRIYKINPWCGCSCIIIICLIFLYMLYRFFTSDEQTMLTINIMSIFGIILMELFYWVMTKIRTPILNLRIIFGLIFTVNIVSNCIFVANFESVNDLIPYSFDVIHIILIIVTHSVLECKYKIFENVISPSV